MKPGRGRLRLELVLFAALLLFPLLGAVAPQWSALLERQLVTVFIFAVLVLALNLQVGYAGLLQLGIAGFFAIGAFATGILTVEKYPFQVSFWGALLLAPLAAALAGFALGLPTLRLRGDYLAIVTLGFGEVVRVLCLNLENITDGPRGLNPIPEPAIPEALAALFGPGRSRLLTMYYVSLLALAAVFLLLDRLERSRLGRAFVALREDELAASSVGVQPARVKLIAFSAGAALAGLGGALYATNLTTTAEPNTYDFNYSIMVLACLVIGGLGSLRGSLLGAAVLLGFDNVLSPLVTRWLQSSLEDPSASIFTSATNWRWMVFGLVLIAMMRLRPEGLWPSRRVEAELHHQEAPR
jgi:branched-chain amino acid transport system permease protein